MKPFQLCHAGRGLKLTCLECDISWGFHSELELYTIKHLFHVKPIDIPKLGRSNNAEKSKVVEIHSFQSYAGTLLFVGQTDLSQASLTESKMQQRLVSLYMSNILEAIAMVRELQKLIPEILCQNLNGITPVSIIPFPDASHVRMKEIFGQTGALTGFKVVFS